jgi:hypothetical protein
LKKGIIKYFAFLSKHKNLKRKLQEIEVKFLNSLIADKDKYFVQLLMIAAQFTINTLLHDKNCSNVQLQALLIVFSVQMDSFYSLLLKIQPFLFGT